ncbi:hypothetical protein [Onishia taeanensis]
MRRAQALWRVWLAGFAGLMLPMAPAAAEIMAARYALPVERYGHFALGRPHEYARLIASTDDGQEAMLDLPPDEVFEDLAPRLVRLADQASPVLLVIISSRDGGARLALVGLERERLVITAQSPAVGRSHRWLNPVGVADLTGDAQAEIAAVTTPHIGGVLRVFRRRGRHLEEIAALRGFSNHVLGSAELDLSMPLRIAGRMRLLVPDERREVVRVISLRDTRLVETDRCPRGEPITGPAALQECARRLARAAPVRP